MTDRTMAKSILIIDDDLSVRITLKGVINYFLKKSHKVSVFSAGDGVEGLGHLFIDPPDLLIIDLTLPKYDGLEILDYIKTNKDLMHHKELPIIVLIQDHLGHQPFTNNFSVLHKNDTNFTQRLLAAIHKKLGIQQVQTKASDKKHVTQSLILWVSNKIIKISDTSDSVFQNIATLPVSLRQAFNRFKFVFLQLQVSNFLLFFYWLTTKQQTEENIVQAHKDFNSLRVKAVPAVGVLISSILFLIAPLVLFGTTFLATLWLAIFPAHASNLTWDGGGASNNWSDCANWSSDTCPTAIDSVIFNATSTKDAIVDAVYTGTIHGLSVKEGYTGTITLARGITITGDFVQEAGHFIAGANNMTVSGGDFTSSADFTAPSMTLTIAEDFTVATGSTFTPNSGTIVFSTGEGTSAKIVCNNHTFAHVAFVHNSPKNISSGCDLPLGNNPTLAGTGMIVLAGKLSGNGVLTKSKGMLEIQSGAEVSGFSGIITTRLPDKEVSDDKHAPTGSISINAGNQTTSSQEITLTINATDTVTSNSGLRMKVSSNRSFLGARYIPYKKNKPFDFAVGEGVKTVYVRFVDEAGNESAVYSDSITYDR